MPTLAGGSPALPDLPPALRGPVAVALLRSVERLPAGSALPGGCWYEPKWDGFRLVVVRAAGSTRVWSRQGRDLTARFPDVVDAARAQLPAGTVVDGEVVVWSGDRLDFALLQRRLVIGPNRVPALASAHPASFVAFDVLAAVGRDVRDAPLRRRRAALEELAAGWRPPLQLCPGTADPAVAAGWMAAYRSAGLEGLVVKGSATRYLPGRRDWLKVKSRETTEVVVGGVIGPIGAPQQLVVGRYRGDELVLVGRTSPLDPRQSAAAAAVLTPAGPGHPWPERVGTGRYGGGRLSIALTRVQPTAVVEVSADAALTAGVFRHPLRFVRLRPDLAPADVERLP